MTLDVLFLVVMLPSSLTSSPAHQVHLLEETDKLGCEIVGPNRTTRWWFSLGHNGLDVEVHFSGRRNDQTSNLG